MRVACVQLKAYDLDRAEEGLAHALAMTECALAGRPDLVVLPECTYPAYFLAGYRGTRLRPVEEVLGMFARLASQGNCYLAAGLVEPGPQGTLYNTAFLLSPAGEVAARGRKHLLWHFDCRWFTPGAAPALASTPWGKVGVFVCADGRLPEIPRLLALQGARLQLDLTGWVSSGRDPARLNNPQAEYMLRVRALENRCYMAAANKVGMEAGRIVYCGRSQVVSPEGHILAQAGSLQPEVICADIEPAAPAPLSPDFDPLRDREPAAYARLAAAPPVPAPRTPAHVVRLAAVQLARPHLLCSFMEGLAYEGATAVVTSPLPGSALPSSTVPQPDREMPAPPVRVLAWRSGREIAARVEAPGLRAAVHLPLSPDGRVFDTPAGRVGVMLDREALLPEVPRVLALQGADWLAWPCSLPADLVEAVARTRAAENKVFVVAANAPGPAADGAPPPGQTVNNLWHGPWASPGGASLVVDPDGRILAQAFTGTDQSIGGQAHLGLARCKTIVPGTDAFAGRQPAAYAALAESPPPA